MRRRTELPALAGKEGLVVPCLKQHCCTWQICCSGGGGSSVAVEEEGDAATVAGLGQHLLLQSAALLNRLWSCFCSCCCSAAFSFSSRGWVPWLALPPSLS